MPRLLLVCILTAATGAPVLAQSPGEIVGYYTSWSIYRRNYQVRDIPAAQLTRLNYAFANVVGGQAVLGDPVADLQNFVKLRSLRQTHPHLKILLSVGGWTWSSGISDAVLTAASRQAFAASCVSLMTVNGFDGLDIDWEFPVSGGLVTNINRPEDKQNYTLFMAELRRQLDVEEVKQSRSFQLTMTASANPSVISNFEIAKIQAYVDSISVMANSFHGPWAPGLDLTGFSAALYPDPKSLYPEPSKSEFNVGYAIQSYLDLGVPRQKLHLGLAFQGIGFAGVSGSANGLYGLYTGAPTGTWSPGYFDYTDLEANYIAKNGYQQYWHDIARVPWLFNPTTSVMITYEDPRSILEKIRFARALGLGGAMFWELSADRNKSLLNVVHAEMTRTEALRAPVRTISAAKPARIDLLVETDATRAGRFYYILGSLSGTTPGLPLSGGVLPLNFDTLTTVTIWYANSPLLPASTGQLDATGAARAGFNAATLGVLPASLIGTRVSFASWILQSQSSITGAATNPVDVFITP